MGIDRSRCCRGIRAHGDPRIRRIGRFSGARARREHAKEHGQYDQSLVVDPHLSHEAMDASGSWWTCMDCRAMHGPLSVALTSRPALGEGAQQIQHDAVVPIPGIE